MAKAQVFISYSSKDADWKDRVLAPLRALEANGRFHIWDDSRIGAGDRWKPEIFKAIERSSAAVLLITNSFLSSKFIIGKEVRSILKQQKKVGMRVFPLIVKPCPWQAIRWLERFQVRPEKGRPLVRASEWDAEQDLADFAREVLQKLDEPIEVLSKPPARRERSRVRAAASRPPARAKASRRWRIAVVSLDAGLRSLNRWLDGLTGLQSLLEFERRSMSPPVRSIGHVEGEQQLKVYRLSPGFQREMVATGDKAVVGLTPETLAFEEGDEIFYNHLGAPSSVDDRIGFLSVASLEEYAEEAEVELRAAFSYTLASYLAWQLGELAYHDEIVGCPMDYTEDHTDIVEGLRRGEFCGDCEALLKKDRNKKLLAALQAMLGYGRE